MKLSYLKIENFRGIEHLEIDFTDELGRIRDLTLLVGPNGSGKSAILDAIWFGLQDIMGYENLRYNFRSMPDYALRKHNNFAYGEYRIVVNPEEKPHIVELRTQLQSGIRSTATLIDEILVNPEIHLEWTYPSQPGYKGFQSDKAKNKLGYRFHTPNFFYLAHKYLASTLQEDSLVIDPVDIFRELGHIYLFEQERRINAEPVFSTPKFGDYATLLDLNIREVLVDFGIKEKMSSHPESRALYSRVQAAYNLICTPRKMGNVFATSEDKEFEIEFFDDEGKPYGFDGLSSGERSVLNFLVQYVAKRMKNSIILIDELELYLHPDWQYRLLQSLMQMKDGNQFIIATHSPTLRQYVSSASVIELGQLQTISSDVALLPDVESA